MLGTKIPELMEFPSQITFKVIGKEPDVIAPQIQDVFQAEGLQIQQLSSKLSNKGVYTSFSVTFVIQSPEQMERLYIKLAEIPSVVMVI